MQNPIDKLIGFNLRALCEAFDRVEHLVIMLFGVLKHFDSLRELEIGMKAETMKLSHLGLDYVVRRSTLDESQSPTFTRFLCQSICLSLGTLHAFFSGQPPNWA